MCIGAATVASGVIAIAAAPAGLVLLLAAELGHLGLNLLHCQPTSLPQGVLELKHSCFQCMLLVVLNYILIHFEVCPVFVLACIAVPA
jgi:hypothetical protein